LIVFALIKFQTIYIALAGDLRWIEHHVVHMPLLAGPAPAQARDQHFAGNVDIRHAAYRSTQFLQHPVQGRGLRRRARKTIQHGAPSAIRPRQAFADHGDGDVIRHQLAAIHVALCELAQVGFILQVFPEDVAGGDVRQLEAV